MVWSALWFSVGQFCQESRRRRERQQKLKDESNRRKKKFIKEYKALCLKHGCIVEAIFGEGYLVGTDLDPVNMDSIINELMGG